jgi:protein neuralized
VNEVLNGSFSNVSGVNSVLYGCGHMCLCYDCALRQWKDRRGGFCPLCRQEIKDVIKTFKA